MGLVTFKNKGRLGNFLFECAAAISYSIDNRLDFSIPIPSKGNFWNPVYFPYLFKQGFIGMPSVLIREDENAFFDYTPLPFHGWTKHRIVLDGYFQHAGYFKHNLQEIINLWRFDKIITVGNTVGVHVRRGDYVNYPTKHILITPEWVRKALQNFPGYNVIIFTDSPQWVRENLPEYPIISNDILGDFIQLASCEHLILSPSTFAYWAGVVNPNPNKRIIITNHWFSPKYQFNADHIIPETWTKQPI